MTKHLPLAFILVFLSCTRTNVLPLWQQSSLQYNQYSYLPFMRLSFADNGISYNAMEIQCINSDVLDSAKRHFSITGNDGIFGVQIQIKTDSLRLMTYNLSDQNGTVEMYKYGEEIGYLGGGSLSLTILENSSKGISGYFQGKIVTSLSSGMASISGDFAKIEINEQ